MTREEILEWVQAVLLALFVLAAPHIVGHIALALGLG